MGGEGLFVKGAWSMDQVWRRVRMSVHSDQNSVRESRGGGVLRGEEGGLLFVSEGGEGVMIGVPQPLPSRLS